MTVFLGGMHHFGHLSQISYASLDLHHSSLSKRMSIKAKMNLNNAGLILSKDPYTPAKLFINGPKITQSFERFLLVQNNNECYDIINGI